MRVNILDMNMKTELTLKKRFLLPKASFTRVSEFSQKILRPESTCWGASPIPTIEKIQAYKKRHFI